MVPGATIQLGLEGHLRPAPPPRTGLRLGAVSPSPLLRETQGGCLHPKSLALTPLGRNKGSGAAGPSVHTPHSPAACPEMERPPPLQSQPSYGTALLPHHATWEEDSRDSENAPLSHTVPSLQGPINSHAAMTPLVEQAFGLAIEPPVGTPASHTGEPGFRTCFKLLTPASH